MWFLVVVLCSFVYTSNCENVQTITTTGTNPRLFWLVPYRKITITDFKPMFFGPEGTKEIETMSTTKAPEETTTKAREYPVGSLDEDKNKFDNAWEESGKIEGDMILNDRQRRLIIETVEGMERNGLTDITKRWPNNEVIYYIKKEHFTKRQVTAIHEAINVLKRASCIKFRPYRSGDDDALIILGNKEGCNSKVGYQGGYQVLNLSNRYSVGSGCFKHGTIIHELLHTLGFFHMQSSSDRDNYVEIVWNNIKSAARPNFKKYNSYTVSDFGVGYDYNSIMHYGQKAFSANGKDTIVPKKRGANIGQREGLSRKDTLKLNKMYCRK